MRPNQHADQERQRSRATPRVVEAPTATVRMPSRPATLSSTEVLALQRTLGNAAVNQLLRPGTRQHTTARARVQRQVAHDAGSPSQQSGRPVLIQRMGVEDFYMWFRRARALGSVEQRHEFLLRSLGWREFGSFQVWLQRTNTVHEMFGQDRPQPQQASGSSADDMDMDVDTAPSGSVLPPQPQVQQQQQFLAQFEGEALPGNAWREFTSSDDYTVNVHWHHILNHTYRYMYTTDSKPSHSLFPPGTSANDLATYVREAIEQFPNTNPTLSCGTVTVGWDKKGQIDSIVTFFPSLQDGHRNKLDRSQLELLQEHYGFA
jgi:hypothetical protein